MDATFKPWNYATAAVIGLAIGAALFFWNHGSIEQTGLPYFGGYVAGAAIVAVAVAMLRNRLRRPPNQR